MMFIIAATRGCGRSPGSERLQENQEKQTARSKLQEWVGSMELSCPTLQPVQLTEVELNGTVLQVGGWGWMTLSYRWVGGVE